MKRLFAHTWGRRKSGKAHSQTSPPRLRPYPSPPPPRTVLICWCRVQCLGGPPVWLPHIPPSHTFLMPVQGVMSGKPSLPAPPHT